MHGFLHSPGPIPMTGGCPGPRALPPARHPADRPALRDIAEFRFMDGEMCRGAPCGR